MRRRPSICPLLAAAIFGVAFSAPAHADAVGAAGAVNTRSSGEPPGGEPRVIEIGAQVVENERIRTSDTGSVQVLFIDKTTLNVGPQSNLVIDRFVYNPVTNRGEVVLDLSKGVLRVVGGAATHTDGATVKTPVASIGVRGGIATITHGARGTRAVLGFGHMTVTNLCASGDASCSARTVEISRPGYGVTIAGPNEPPTAPSRASADDLARMNGQLGSRGGQTGGSPTQPTDTQAASYQIGTPNSPIAPIPNAAVARRGNALAAIATATQQTVQQAAQVGASVKTTQTAIVQRQLTSAPPTPPTPTTPPTSPTPPTTPTAPTPPTPPVTSPTPPVTSPTPPVTPGPTTTYAILTPGPFSTSSGSSPVPYLTGAFAGTGGFTISPIRGYQAGGLNADGTPNTVSRQFQAGLSVTGQGSSQNATLFVMTSEIRNAPTVGYTQAGGFEGVTMRNGAHWYGAAYGAVSSATPSSPANSVPNVNGIPNASYSLYNADTDLVTGAVANAQSYNFVHPAPANYTFNPIATGTPTTSASNHPILALEGYVGGVMTTATGGSSPPFANYTTPYIVTNYSNSPGDVSIFLPGNSSTMGAFFDVASVNAPTNAMTSAIYFFGSYNPNDTGNIAGLNTSRSAYVDPSNFAARAAAVYNNGANTPIAVRNANSNPQPYGFANQLLVTSDAVGANTSSFLSSISSAAVQPCQCESTKWGFWSADNGTFSNNQLQYGDQGVLLLWVAGQPTSPGSLPASGTATYSGHAIADVATTPNSGAAFSYLAAGTFQNVVNFGAGTGAVTIGNLDGATYSGTVNLTGGTTQFGGTIGSTVNGRMATLAGSFFQGGPTNSTPGYGEMGGSLSLTGPSYLGSGIFAARKP